MASVGKTYIVEHLDDELGPWSKLEYMTIAKESHENGAKVYLLMKQFLWTSCA